MGARSLLPVCPSLPDTCTCVSTCPPRNALTCVACNSAWRVRLEVNTTDQTFDVAVLSDDGSVLVVECARSMCLHRYNASTGTYDEDWSAGLRA